MLSKAGAASVQDYCQHEGPAECMFVPMKACGFGMGENHLMLLSNIYGLFWGKKNRCTKMEVNRLQKDLRILPFTFLGRV